MEFNESWHFSCSTVGIAAREGCLNTIQKLVASGKPVDVADNRGCRPLHEAVNGNHIDCVEFLLAQDETDVNWKTFINETALHLACKQNSFDIAKLLLNHGALTNIKNDEWRTPLLIAASKSANELVTLLLEKGANINEFDMNNWTALHFAVDKKNLDLLKLLLKNKVDFLQPDEHGRNAVFLACEKNSFPCVQLLVEFAIQQGEKDIMNHIAIDGANAFIIAAEKGNLKIIKYLIENGANVNQITNDGCMALHLAVAVADDIECVNLLLEKTDFEILKQPCVRDLIHLAVANKRHKILEILLNTNLPIDVECKILSSVNQIDIYETLILSNSNLNTKNVTFTPLGRAVFYGDEKSAEMLLKAGANPNAISDNCIAPLALSVHCWNEYILMLLLKAGAAVNYSKVDWCESEIAVSAIYDNRWNFLNTLIVAGVNDINFVYKTSTSRQISMNRITKPLPLVYDFVTLASQCLQWSSFLNLFNYYSDEKNLRNHSRLSLSPSQYKPFHVGAPPSLKHFCRLKIRKQLMLSGAPSMYKIDLTGLGLPNTLKKYILFEIHNGGFNEGRTSIAKGRKSSEESKSVHHTFLPPYFGELAIRHPKQDFGIRIAHSISMIRTLGVNDMEGFV